MTPRQALGDACIAVDGFTYEQLLSLRAICRRDWKAVHGGDDVDYAHAVEPYRTIQGGDPMDEACAAIRLRYAGIGDGSWIAGAVHELLIRARSKT